MEAVTGRAYFNKSSDIDIIISAKTYSDILDFHNNLATEPAMKDANLDIELEIGHSYCVKLKEFISGKSTILAKGIWDVRLFEIDDVKGRFFRSYREITAQTAVKALLYEVAVTPKPGLVDLNNNGAHQDMDVFTFIDSATALIPHFMKFFDAGAAGAGTKDLPLCNIFENMRYLGMLAEDDMLAATGGINTHKGAIFSLGLICAAIGYQHAAEGKFSSERVFEICAEMTAPILTMELDNIKKERIKTFGEKLYANYVIRGIRGEAASGFQTVRKIGLPVLKAEIKKGKSINDAAVTTLLHFIASTVDTNMIKRGGLTKQNAIRNRVIQLLKSEEIPSVALELDEDFIRENLSPGGSADMLTVTLMLHFMDTAIQSH